MQLSWAQGRNGVYADPSTGEGTAWGPAISSLRFVADPAYPYDRNGRLVDAASAPAGSLPEHMITPEHSISAV
ncbi:MAG: hypothetical protein ACK47E_06245 [Cyclobacteriaceae bacterium]